MSAGFIPMVSTTPPPIDDDDDFGDFHDSNHHDDFGDFSSHVDEDDFSCSSVGTPTGSKSLSFQEDDEITQIKNQHNADDPVFNSNEKDLHREVEIILQDSEKGKNKSDAQSDMDIVAAADIAKENSAEDVVEKNDTFADDAVTKTEIQNDINLEPELTNHGSENGIKTSNGFSNSSDDESGDWLDAVDSPTPIAEKGVDVATELPGDFPQNIGRRSTSPSTDSKQGDSPVAINEGPPSDIENESSANAATFSDTESVGRSPSPCSGEAPDAFSNDEGSPNQPDFHARADVALTPDMGAEALTDEDSVLETVKNSAGVVPTPDIGVDALTDEDSALETGEHSADVVPTPDVGAEALPDEDSILQTVEHSAGEVPTPDMGADALTDKDSILETVKNSDVQSNTVSGETNQCYDASEDKDEDFGDFSSIRLQTEEQANNVVLTDNDHPSASEPPPAEFECDFAAFDSAPGGDENGDGFADFSAAPASSAKTVAASDWSDGEEDDEFGAFGTNDDDFGAFASENNDDFGEFGSSSAAETWPATSQSIIKVVPVHEKIKNYVSSYSRRKEDECEDQTITPLEKLKTKVLTNMSETHSSPSKDSSGVLRPDDLWNQLEDIDNTIALNFVWNGSGHNKHLLDSLGMRTQNILFSGSKQAYYVPTYYAAALGMVDPTKGILRPMSAAEKITAMSPTEKSAPTGKDEAITSTEPHPEWKSVADEHDNGDIMVVESSGSWSSGGGRPGNSGFSESATHDNGSARLGTFDGPAADEKVASVPIITSAMDLDYLDTIPVARDGTRPPESSDLIDPELLELTTAPTTEPPPPPKDSGSATLSKILASIKNAGNSSSSSSLTTINTVRDTSKWQEEESKLSPEARSVLQRLPDLSFMKSKVLLFPMNFPGVNLSEDPC